MYLCLNRAVLLSTWFPFSIVTLRLRTVIHMFFQVFFPKWVTHGFIFHMTKQLYFSKWILFYIFVLSFSYFFRDIVNCLNHLRNIHLIHTMFNVLSFFFWKGKKQKKKKKLKYCPDSQGNTKWSLFLCFLESIMFLVFLS